METSRSVSFKAPRQKLNKVPLLPTHQQQPRTRDENQERAYIAASRRTDRSLEARLQSAHKASDLHKKRTGKALRITGQIVFNDETYEEEDAWVPASQSLGLLGPQLRTPSAELNARVEAYLEQKMVMSSFVAATTSTTATTTAAAAAAAATDEGQGRQRQRQQRQDHQRWGEIDRLFAESFPNAAQTARRLADDLVPARGVPSVLPQGQGQGQQQERIDDDGVPRSATGPEVVTSRGGEGDGAAAEEDTVWPLDLDRADADGEGSAQDSVFTADLPGEVLMFMGGQSQGDEALYGACLKGGQDVSFGAFDDGAAFVSFLGEDAPRLTTGGAGERQPTWGHEPDAYPESSAWMGFGAADETFV